MLAAALDAAKTIGGSSWSYEAIVAVGIATFLITFFVLLRWPHVSIDSETEGLLETSDNPPRSDRSNQGKAERACEGGPFVIKGGESLTLRLEVSKGERVIGTVVSESSGEDFDFGIFDARGTARFERKENPRPAVGGKNLSAYHVDWIVPYDDRWSVVLSNRGRSKRRFVKVDLDRSPS